MNNLELNSKECNPEEEEAQEGKQIIEGENDHLYQEAILWSNLHEEEHFDKGKRDHGQQHEDDWDGVARIVGPLELQEHEGVKQEELDEVIHVETLEVTQALVSHLDDLDAEEYQLSEVANYVAVLVVNWIILKDNNEEGHTEA